MKKADVISTPEPPDTRNAPSPSDSPEKVSNSVSETTDHPPSFADRKLRLGEVAGTFFSSILNPRKLVASAKLHRSRRENRKLVDDAQLKLYASALPGDFLHFGYFDEPNIDPAEMRLNDIPRAQDRYAEQLLSLIAGPQQAVLDVGCGMGGLAKMLVDQGHTVTAITPDRSQAAYVEQTLPTVAVIRSKFEKIDVAKYVHRFDTVVTSESLQYLKLGEALPIISKVLSPEGRWIACDFFYKAPSTDRSLHCWPDFKQQLTKYGWRLTNERDITPNVLPTLRYIHMWAEKFGLPLINFATHKFERKQPGLHHLCESTLGLFQRFAQSHVDIIDPDRFTAEKVYMLLAIERA